MSPASYLTAPIRYPSHSVEPEGIEPSAFAMPLRRAPSCAMVPWSIRGARPRHGMLPEQIISLVALVRMDDHACQDPVQVGYLVIAQEPRQGLGVVLAPVAQVAQRL